jgi:chromosome segregation protein
MIFRNLTMAGFKSFAEKVEIDIDPGLTGIVGPNGCGKSNIVEAMRWIMGESSARQMRGTEMDDIIFAGTENRPARNLAEILLKLDNSSRTAPADFNNADELEIIRKVQRGKGSSYLINGRPARAKDVQLLFADTASGARSAGIVSQGRIGAIVGAKPEDRRSLIEEAANIKGLHQRKRDAELKLRGTETNLERLDDIIQQLSEQRAQLAKQARQAARYRSVADRIRTAEAQLLRARWYIARAASDEAKKRDSVCRQEIETATRNNAAIAIQLATAAATLPALRDAEAAQAAEVQKFILTLRDYERELAQIASTQQRLTSQLAQIDADAVREDTLHGDASTALDGLADELKAQEEAVSLNGPRLDDARQALEAARSKSAAADTAAATLRAKRLAVQAARESKRAQDTQLAERIARTETDLAGLNISQRETEGYEASERRDDAERAARDANTAFDACEAALNAADIAREEDLTRFRDADAIVTRLTAELDALSYLLSESDSQIGTPMSDLVSV